MKTDLQSEKVESGAANHHPQNVVPRKVEATQGKVHSGLAAPTAQVAPAGLPSDVQFSFGSATISITVPSIIITPSATSGSVEDSAEKEWEKFRENTSASFDKYEEQQEKLIAASYEKADNLLLTISSGILALSATFIGTLLSNKHSLKDLWYLRGGWGSLGLTVVFVLVSYFASRKSLSYSVEAARSNKDSSLSKDDGEQENFTKKSECYTRKRETFRKLTEALNLTATIAFIVGLGLIVTFAVMNIR